MIKIKPSGPEVAAGPLAKPPSFDFSSGRCSPTVAAARNRGFLRQPSSFRLARPRARIDVRLSIVRRLGIADDGQRGMLCAPRLLAASRFISSFFRG